MVKVKLMLEKLKEGATTPGTIKSQIVGLLRDNPDEIFSKKEILEKLPDIKENTLAGMLWYLSKDGLIDKTRIGRLMYYGSKEAIQQIRNYTEAQADAKASKGAAKV